MKDLAAKVELLRADYATAQATADQLRVRLQKAEARLTGQPDPENGLDMLWKAAPAMGRNRSSKYKCRQAWNRLPHAARPPVQQLLAALRAWSRCEEWKRDEGQFVPALHRWISERRWEDLPESPGGDPLARYRRPPPEPPPGPPADAPTPAELAAMFEDFNQKMK